MFAFAAAVGPEAPITAFVWAIPGGIAKEIPDPADPNAVQDLIQFSMFVPERADLRVSEFAVLVVGPNANPVVIGNVVGSAIHGKSITNLTELSEFEAPVPFKPSTLVATWDKLAVGDKLTFVVALRAELPGTVDFTFRAVAASQDFASAPDSLEALTNGETPKVVPGRLVGQGLQVGFFALTNVFLPGLAMQQSILMSPSAKFLAMARLPIEPGVVSRSADLTFSFEGPGYGEAMGAYVAAGLVPCPATGSYNVSFDLHGNLAHHESVMLPADALGLSGLSILSSSGEGPTGSALRFQVDVTHACSVEFWMMQTLEIGVGLKEIIGTAASPKATVYPGLLGELPIFNGLSDRLTDILPDETSALANHGNGVPKP